jgi:hypothetical protein
MTQSDAWLDEIATWLATFDEIAPGTIEGLYVVGSAAMNDWQETSNDIDIIAVTAEPADDETAGTLLTANAVFAERHPQRSIDGPFVAWGDLVVPAQSITRPWSLDGNFHHDAECFEINPVTWFMLAKYGVRVRGPQPSEMPIAFDADERIRFVIDNSNSFWHSVLEELDGAIGELGASDTLPSSVPAWCLLGACRMLYTATTADVTSKSAAGRWAAGVLGDEHRAICNAVVSMRAEPERPVGRDQMTATEAAMRTALERTSALTT